MSDLSNMSSKKQIQICPICQIRLPLSQFLSKMLFAGGLIVSIFPFELNGSRAEVDEKSIVDA